MHKMTYEQILWATHNLANTTLFQLVFWSFLGALTMLSLVVWIGEMNSFEEVE